MTARTRAPERAPHLPVQPIKRVLALMDMTGFARFCRSHEDHEAVALLDAYYHRCFAAIDAAGGSIVKFMGDGCLASFAPEQAADAVAVAERLAEDVAELGHRHGSAIGLSANLHMATVLVGALGPEAVAREDVFGVGVNHTFLMGKGEGIRLSEPVYRALPSDARSPWKKERPPARYTRRG
jgi:adenylate cyclase